MRNKVTFLGGRNFNKNGGVLQSQHNYVDHLQAIYVGVWGEGEGKRGLSVGHEQDTSKPQQPQNGWWDFFIFCQFLTV